jgi:two-component system sensor histidine kinase DesK
MTLRAQRNIFGLIGLAGCLFSGGFDAIHIWYGGGRFKFPLGQLAEWLASFFTQPPSLLRAGSDHDALSFYLLLGLYLAVTMLFAALFWQRTAAASAGRIGGYRLSLALQMACALSYPHTLLYLLAAEFGMVLTLRRGLLWLAAQNGLLAALILLPLIGNDHLGPNFRFVVEVVELAIIGVWQSIAFGIGYMAASERRGRMALHAANNELRATQLLLLDTVRASERMRIARDLHDIVGHHLTALHLHLDLALRQQGEQAPPALQTARTLAQSLLAQVRTVVGAERLAERIALREALCALCEGIPAPRIALDVEEGLEIDSAALAHALFCCVQEAISNVVRHAGASVLTISLAREGDGVALRIGDDGRGNGGAPEGHGLRGMRERLAALGGSVKAANLPQRGFGLDIAVPLAGAPA